MKLNESLSMSDKIKSVRIYEENGLLKLDYRVHNHAKLPKGKKGNRFRMSTSKVVNSINRKYVEKHKYEIAVNYYGSLFDDLENKDVVLFKDIAHLALKEAEAGRRKMDSTKDYERILDKFILPTFGDMDIKSIKVKDIRAWMSLMGKLKISQSRYNKYHYVLKRVMDYANENEYAFSNAMQYIKRSSPLFKNAKPKNENYYIKEEVYKILNDDCEGCTAHELSKHSFISSFSHVAFLTGARTGEIMALKWEDIDFKNGIITIQRSITRGVISSTKTGAVRSVPMVEKLHEKLLEYQEEAICDWVFPNPQTRSPYTYSRTIVDHKFKPMLERLNIPYKGLYQSRHSFASLSVQSGVDMHVVKECMGHSDISTTQRYYLRFGNLDKSDVKSQLEVLTA